MRESKNNNENGSEKEVGLVVFLRLQRGLGRSGGGGSTGTVCGCEEVGWDPQHRRAASERQCGSRGRARVAGKTFLVSSPCYCICAGSGCWPTCAIISQCMQIRLHAAHLACKRVDVCRSPFGRTGGGSTQPCLVPDRKGDALHPPRLSLALLRACHVRPLLRWSVFLLCPRC